MQSAAGGKKPNLKVIAIGAAVGIVAIIGILFVILAGKTNPEDVKKELKEKLEEVEKLGADQIIEKHRRLKELQADPRFTTETCGVFRKNLDKAEEDARPHAERQKKGDEEAKPFIDAYDTRGLDQAKAQNMLDKVSSLIFEYQTTTHGPRLEEIKRELLAWLEANASGESAAGAFQAMEYAATRAAQQEKDFKKAFGLLKEFEEKFAAEITGALRRRVDGRRETLERQLRSFVDETKGSAQDMIDRTQTDNARNLLRDAMQKTEGLPGFNELETLFRSIGGS